MQALRAAWPTRLAGVAARDLVFIDEGGCNRAMTRARAPQPTVRISSPIELAWSKLKTTCERVLPAPPKHSTLPSLMDCKPLSASNAQGWFKHAEY